MIDKRPQSSDKWLGPILAIVTAIPFLLGALLLAFRLHNLSVIAGMLARAQILGAALFAFGIALGVVGSAFALASRARHRRVLGTALTLFGISHVLFGIYVRHAVERTIGVSQPPLLPLLAISALWAYSAILAFRAPKLAAQAAMRQETAPSEEQPLPLSRP